MASSVIIQIYPELKVKTSEEHPWVSRISRYMIAHWMIGQRRVYSFFQVRLRWIGVHVIREVGWVQNFSSAEEGLILR